MDTTVPMLKNITLVEKQLEEVAENIANKYVWRCGQMVREKAYDLCPRDTGELANSLDVVEITNESVGVGTNKEYAVYVHEGTGLYAKDGVETARPRGSYWIYIETPNGGYGAYKRQNPGQSKTYATLAEAKKAWFYLHEILGLDAHITQGQRPRPFLNQALQECEPLFDGILEEVMKEAVR